ncbi:MAG: RHS repeat-associated core domain-containing protein [Gammaproteobacteria bacterium]
MYRYDVLNRLTRLETYDGTGSLVEQYDYTLEATGRRTGLTEQDGRDTRYTYDSLYRLTTETITDPNAANYQASYTYDAVGNRILEVIDGVTTAYTYDANDRLIQQGGTQHSYDANGNLLSITLDGLTTGYVYNSKNNLISADTTNGALAFSYNADGIRTGKTAAGSVTQYLVDSNRDYAQVLVESDGANEVFYAYGDDLLSQRRSGADYFYHYDGLGSTRALSDATGSITDTYDYETFGTLLNKTGETANDYLFTGEQYNQGLGQYYLRARYYDQGVGRFTQMDTWMGNNYDPVTLHKYLYANVDPVNYVDPTGKFGVGSFSFSSGISLTFSLARFTARAGSPIGRAIKATAAFGATGALLKSEVKKCYTSKGKRCLLPNIVVIGSSKHPESQNHIQDAITGNGSNGAPIPALVTYKKSANKDRSWIRQTRECKNKTGKGTGLDCDEFPFATSVNGGLKGYRRNMVSLRPISSCDNQCAGRLWGRAVRRGQDRDKYLVVPEGIFSFYFSNGEYGE